MEEKRLYRSESDKMLGGVCGGIAEVYGHDPSLVRITFVVLGLATGFFPIALGYLLAWIIIPAESQVKED